jgi:hypothetical protein
MSNSMNCVPPHLLCFAKKIIQMNFSFDQSYFQKVSTNQNRRVPQMLKGSQRH